MATSDEAMRERTGRGWEEWFDLLDEWGAADLSHRDIARRVASELAIDPLAWNAQAITLSYEPRAACALPASAPTASRSPRRKAFWRERLSTLKAQLAS